MLASTLRNACRKSLNVTIPVDHPRKATLKDWWRDGQTQRNMKSAVEQVLDDDLPDSYDRVLFKEKNDNYFLGKELKT